MTAPIDYNAVLSDLEAKRAQLDAAIQVIRALIGSGATTGGESGPAEPINGENGTGGASGRPAPGGGSIATDAFFRLSTPAAVKKYLNMMRRPQKPRIIADALQAGGQVHATDSQTAYMNVHTALKRGKDKDFVQTRNGEWGLAEWYSGKSKGEGE
jgi:hypothetical protein